MSIQASEIHNEIERRSRAFAEARPGVYKTKELARAAFERTAEGQRLVGEYREALVGVAAPSVTSKPQTKAHGKLEEIARRSVRDGVTYEQSYVRACNANFDLVLDHRRELGSNTPEPKRGTERGSGRTEAYETLAKLARERQRPDESFEIAFAKLCAEPEGFKLVEAHRAEQAARRERFALLRAEA